jgi:hypothetical protein
MAITSDAVGPGLHQERITCWDSESHLVALRDASCPVKVGKQRLGQAHFKSWRVLDHHRSCAPTLPACAPIPLLNALFTTANLEHLREVAYSSIRVGQSSGIKAFPDALVHRSRVAAT